MQKKEQLLQSIRQDVRERLMDYVTTEYDQTAAKAVLIDSYYLDEDYVSYHITPELTALSLEELEAIDPYVLAENNIPTVDELAQSWYTKQLDASWLPEAFRDDVDEYLGVEDWNSSTCKRWHACGKCPWRYSCDTVASLAKEWMRYRDPSTFELNHD